MKKSMRYSLGILVLAAIMYCAHFSIDNFSLKVKIGFISKILLITGIVGLWLFGISDSMNKK